MLKNFAQQLVKNEICIVPIKPDGSKAPAISTWKEYQSRRPITTELDNWFGNGHDYGIAVVCGKISGGLEIIDFDDPNIFPNWYEAVAQAGGEDILAKSLIINTPSDGFHVYYKCNSIEGNQKLAQRLSEDGKTETMIETRGQGGYALTVGSPKECHPLNKEYEIFSGSFDSIPIITPEQRDLLLNCTRQFNEVIKPKQTISGKVKGSNNRPGDDYNAKTSWEQILLPAGWSIVREAGNSIQWRRPDKADDGISATTNYQNSDLLYVFSSNASPFESECAYSKFATYAILNHNRDFTNAAKSLAEQGYGTALESIDYANAANWETPIEFEDSDLPEINSNFLPPVIKDYVDAIAISTQTPPDMAVMVSLAIMSSCLQKRFEVVVDKTYKEPLSLWTLTALPPASRKTAVLDHLRAPIVEWEARQAIDLEPLIIRTEAENIVNSKRIEDIQRQASKELDLSAKEELLKEICNIKEIQTEVPVPPKIFVTDTTPEALQVLLAENGGRASVISDEGAIFDIMTGIYNEGRANLDVFLQGHAAGTTRVRRQGRVNDLSNIAVSFGLCVQPEVLSGISYGGKKTLRGKGLMARFLYALPKSNIGYRNVRERREIPMQVTERYFRIIKQLLDIPAKIENCVETNYSIGLTNGAKEIWYDFSQQLEYDQRDGGKFELMRDWTGKLPGAILRIAGLIEVVKNIDNRQLISSFAISEETMSQIITLAHSLIIHAQRAFGTLEQQPAFEDARWIRDHLLDYLEHDDNGALFIRQSRLQTLNRFKNSSIERLTKALEILQQRHLLSPQIKKKTGQAKAKIIYYVNIFLNTKVS
jgi:hypothetical protein